MYLLCSFYQILVEKTCSDICVSSISTLAPKHCKNREKLTKLACIDNYSRYNFFGISCLEDGPKYVQFTWVFSINRNIH